MDIDTLRRAVFEDLAGIEDEVPSLFSRALERRAARSKVPLPEQFVAAVEDEAARAEIVDVLAEIVGIALHSVLVTIDGGSASAEVGMVQLVDENGESLGDGLHELYIDYLFDTERR